MSKTPITIANTTLLEEQQIAMLQNLLEVALRRE
jgi:hypothetical protein